VDYHHDGDLPGDTCANRSGVDLACDDPRCARSLTRLSAGPQNDFSSDERESACKPDVFLGGPGDRRTASPESVRPDADEQGDYSNEKGLQTQAFSRAAEGIRTLDLLHGKQTL
jgi:hypothetical protein